MPAPSTLQVRGDLGTLCPRGRYSLVEAVEQVSAAIARCRELGVPMLLVDVTGLVDLPVPTLVDRFLMVEDWAQEAQGMVIVAMVVDENYIHPRKFGVKVAHQFGLVCDVCSTEEEAVAWLAATAAGVGRSAG